MKTLFPAAPKTSGHISLLEFIEGAHLHLGAHKRTVMKSQRIDVFHDENPSVYVVVAGRLQVLIATPQGIDVFVTDVECGEMIGEAAALSDGSVPIIIEACEISDVYVMDRVMFFRAIEEHGDFSMAVMRAMCQRLCRVNRRLADTVTLPMHIRLKAELMRLAKPSTDGKLIIDRLPTHEELALRISSQREAVTKELAKLNRCGFISKSGRRLIVRINDVS
ncbi:Crp/Fnr family transcriptional regulator [Ancylobacter amanitiformis]|uniref:CRP-like cAMP-binding protein n=1 Tax=Ancylobacter amanitiformis TaxID=217069 RepID=A0ABU0LWS7_9HYPH|nr:Crp/Fnr family transcriptional regulator [Ancylobacter amanitiformis]MDQ0513184.1 CRP-like cAMP-binding protein [Ancylobacter amanitiformis]